MDANDHVTHLDDSVTSSPQSRCYGNSQNISTPVIRFRASLRNRNDSGYLSSSPALSTSSSASRDRSTSADTDTESPVFRYGELESDHDDSEDVFVGEGVVTQHALGISGDDDDVTDDVSFYEDNDDLPDDTDEEVRGSQNSETDSDSTLRSLTENQANDLMELLHTTPCEHNDSQCDADKEDNDISMQEGDDEEIARITEDGDKAHRSSSRDIPPRPTAPFPVACLCGGDAASLDRTCTCHNDIFIPIPWRPGTALAHPDLHRVNTAPGELNGHEHMNGVNEFDANTLARGRSASFPEVQPHLAPEQLVGRQLRRLSDEFFFDYTGRHAARRRPTPAFYVQIDIQSSDSSRFHDVGDPHVALQHDRHTQTDSDDVNMD